MPIKVTDQDVLGQLLKKVRAQARKAKPVLVGVTSDKGVVYPMGPDGKVTKVNLATIASFLHAGWVQRVTPKQSRFLAAAYGVHVKPGSALVLPPRPFLMAPVRADQKKLSGLIAERLRHDLGFPLQEALLGAGTVLVNDIQMGIKAGGFGGETYPPRAPITKEIYAKKGAGKSKGGKGKDAEATSGLGRDQPLLRNGLLLSAIGMELDT